jgi:PAB-dependent poly(A)-specific ribonuclease subunit 3
MSSVAQAMPPTPYNPYLEDTSSLANNGAAYYTAQSTYTAPAQPVSFQIIIAHVC